MKFFQIIFTTIIALLLIEMLFFSSKNHKQVVAPNAKTIYVLENKAVILKPLTKKDITIKIKKWAKNVK